MAGQRSDAASPKTFAVLRYLVSQAGHLVTKDALLEAVWPETAVSEAVIQVAIRQLRRVLGDQARPARFIETVHGRGYRFIAPLCPLPSSADSDQSRDSPPSSTSHFIPLRTSLGATLPSPGSHSGGPRHGRANGRWG